jgi:hypothetical protein
MWMEMVCLNFYMLVFSLVLHLQRLYFSKNFLYFAIFEIVFSYACLLHSTLKFPELLFLIDDVLKHDGKILKRQDRRNNSGPFYPRRAYILLLRQVP